MDEGYGDFEEKMELLLVNVVIGMYIFLIVGYDGVDNVWDFVVL